MGETIVQSSQHHVTLSIKDLCGGRSNTLAFSNVNLEIKSGEVVVLRGANGAGKTTLLRTLAGLTRAVSGHVDIKGKANTPLTASDSALFAGHLDGLKSGLSAKENAVFWSKLYGVDNFENRIISAFAELGLSDYTDRPASTLSAGQRRRLGLARLLIVDRPLWLLDEPTASMDAEASQKVCEIIERHCVSGGLVVIATHDKLDIPSARIVSLSSQ
ncbi:MAG: heme ABC exporter ATP-binding protein CcmA [Pseudomonadota bacterium]